MGQLLNTNEEAFKEFHQLLNELVLKYNITKHTLRNWVLKTKYKDGLPTEEDIKLKEELIADYISGIPIKIIAKNRNLNAGKVKYLLQQKFYVKKPKYEHFNKAIQLSKEGLNYYEIADKLNISYNQAYYAVNFQPEIEKKKELTSKYKRTLKLLNKGITAKTICKEAKLDYPCYLYWLNRYTTKEKGQYIMKEVSK